MTVEVISEVTPGGKHEVNLSSDDERLIIY